MKRITELALLGCMPIFISGRAPAQATQGAAGEADSRIASVPKDLLSVPPLPLGSSTILGGAIGDVDTVLDRFTLRIVGEKPMKIVYDERTRVFLDGKRIPLNQLRPSEHASVQTTLDGTSVFALSVHILSQLKEGDYRGEVVNYNPATGDLDLVSGMGGDPIGIRVTSETRFERKGQISFAAGQSGPADLQRGTLVSVRFEPDGKGRGSASEITLLATPGSQFVFSGNLISLDIHTGLVMLFDAKDNRSYRIQFNPGTIPLIQSVHAGQRVRITAEYDGTRYLARDVNPY